MNTNFGDSKYYKCLVEKLDWNSGLGGEMGTFNLAYNNIQYYSATFYLHDTGMQISFDHTDMPFLTELAYCV